MEKESNSVKDAASGCGASLIESLGRAQRGELAAPEGPLAAKKKRLPSREAGDAPTERLLAALVQGDWARADKALEQGANVWTKAGAGLGVSVFGAFCRKLAKDSSLEKKDSSYLDGAFGWFEKNGVSFSTDAVGVGDAKEFDERRALLAGPACEFKKAARMADACRFADCVYDLDLPARAIESYGKQVLAKWSQPCEGLSRISSEEVLEKSLEEASVMYSTEFVSWLAALSRMDPIPISRFLSDADWMFESVASFSDKNARGWGALLEVAGSALEGKTLSRIAAGAILKDNPALLAKAAGCGLPLSASMESLVFDWESPAVCGMWENDRVPLLGIALAEHRSKNGKRSAKSLGIWSKCALGLIDSPAAMEHWRADPMPEAFIELSISELEEVYAHEPDLLVAGERGNFVHAWAASDYVDRPRMGKSLMGSSLWSKALEDDARGVSGWSALLAAVGQGDRQELEMAHAKREAKELRAMASARGSKRKAPAKRLRL